MTFAHISRMDSGRPSEGRPGTSGPAATPLMRCVGLNKYFGGVRALNDVTLDLHAGELVCLVGDNGAGKSTFAKLLSGVHQPDEGQIWLDGERVEGLTPHRARDLGIEIVYQHLALCDNLSAVANVTLGQEPVRFRLGPIRFIDRKAAEQEARQRIADVGTRIPDLSSPVRRLSGGQRQGVAIARATVRGHRLIVLDEPTAALGVTQTKATLELARRVADGGVAVVMITHNLDDVFAVADRVVAFRLGGVSLDAPLAATTREEVVACMTGLSMTRAS
jgi:ABC-type sugar transport system ATPase subunit